MKFERWFYEWQELILILLLGAIAALITILVTAPAPPHPCTTIYGIHHACR